jgi:hypothetical protein
MAGIGWRWHLTDLVATMDFIQSDGWIWMETRRWVNETRNNGAPL